jgi:hypothetical protein
MTTNLINKKREEYLALAGQLAILCKNLLDIKTDILLKEDPTQRIKEFEQKEQRTLDYMRRLIEIYSDQPVQFISVKGGDYAQL